jgi:hypothetical protein
VLAGDACLRSVKRKWWNAVCSAAQFSSNNSSWTLLYYDTQYRNGKKKPVRISKADQLAVDHGILHCPQPCY